MSPTPQVRTCAALFVLCAAPAWAACFDGPPPRIDPRIDCVDRALAKIRVRSLRTDRDTPWVIMHGVIAFENDLRVTDARSGNEVNAIDFLLERATYEDRGIFREIDGVPTLPPREQYFQVQDHVDQMLMALADADVPLDRELRADTGRRFRVGDLLAAAQTHLRPGQELGWTLVATSTYVPFGEAWTAEDGRTYRTEDIVSLAIERDPRRETEGGPHHLYGVAYALRRHADAGGVPTGTWEAAADYIGIYVDLARRYQQEDGSFSEAMFRGSRPARSPRTLVSTTGHMLEWLTVALSPEELREGWVGRAVDPLCAAIDANPLGAFSDGGIYHAAHALRRYRDAVGSAPR